MKDVTRKTIALIPLGLLSIAGILGGIFIAGVIWIGCQATDDATAPTAPNFSAGESQAVGSMPSNVEPSGSVEFWEAVDQVGADADIRDLTIALTRPEAGAFRKVFETEEQLRAMIEKTREESGMSPDEHEIFVDAFAEAVFGQNDSPPSLLERTIQRFFESWANDPPQEVEGILEEMNNKFDRDLDEERERQRSPLSHGGGPLLSLSTGSQLVGLVVGQDSRKKRFDEDCERWVVSGREGRLNEAQTSARGYRRRSHCRVRLGVLHLGGSGANNRTPPRCFNRCYPRCNRFVYGTSGDGIDPGKGARDYGL